eukprot:scaffold464_cov39-Tisochrysis_lutea.AAC.3
MGKARTKRESKAVKGERARGMWTGRTVERRLEGSVLPFGRKRISLRNRQGKCRGDAGWGFEPQVNGGCEFEPPMSEPGQRRDQEG